MGKMRRKKTPVSKSSPTGLPSFKELEKEEEEEMNNGPREADNVTTSTIQSLIEKLKSTSAEQREVACCTVLALLADSQSLKPILQSEIVRVVMCLLQDVSLSTRNAASGVLRNLSAVSTDVCDILVNEDIMTPLVAVFHQYELNTKSATEIKDNDETLLQLIHLVWNLCEASDVALNIFNKHSIVNILTRYLDVKTYGNDISIAVAQCLYSVSEDNLHCVDILSQPSIYQSFMEIFDVTNTDTSATILQTLITGIIINIHDCKKTKMSSSLIQKLFNVFVGTFSTSSKDLIVNIASLLKQKSDKDDEIQNLLKKVKDIFIAQELAFECLTNMCSSDDGDDQWEDTSNSDAGDDMVEDDTDAMDCEETKMTEDDINFISPEVHRAISQHNLPSKVMVLSSFPDEDVVQYLTNHSTGSELIKKFSKLSSKALLCFHNLVTSLSVDDLGGLSSVFQTWLQLAEQTFNLEKHTVDAELVEARSSVLRILITKLAESKLPLYEQLASSNIDLIIKANSKLLHCQSLDASSRVNFIRTLGILGSILVGDNGSNIIQVEVVIQEIGKLLLETANKEQELWVLAETIDTIFDLFSEDYTDKVCVQINLIEKLKNVLPVLKAKSKMQKKSFDPHYPVIVTAKDNLPQFIKYKIASAKKVLNDS